MTSLRYFLNPDGSLRAEEEAGRCGEWWRLRWQALNASDRGARRKVAIKMRQHEERCEPCRQFFERCEFYSRGQPDEAR